MTFVSDTHGLVWYLTEDERLGSDASLIFNKADEGEETIIIPTVVLAEIVHICEKKREEIELKKVIDKVKNSWNYVPFDLSLPVVEELTSLREIPGLHDRIIAATARITGSRIVTKDAEIEGSDIETAW